MEPQLIIATVAQKYRLQLTDERTIEPETWVTLRPRGGRENEVATSMITDDSIAATHKNSLDMRARRVNFAIWLVSSALLVFSFVPRHRNRYALACSLA